MSEHSVKDDAPALEVVPKTYEEAVRCLAAVHALGADPIEIYYLPDPEQKTVRLIEVSDTFPEGGVERRAPSSQGVERVVPVFPMGPAKDFPFRSEVAQITPVEWERLHQKTLKLNRDWDLDQAQKVPDGD
jgi:hypothetical protein